MRLFCDATAFRKAMCAFALFGSAIAPSVKGQAAAKPDESKPNSQIYHTIYLTNANEQQAANDLVTALRSMLPETRFYLDRSQNTLSVRATADDMALAQKIVAELDRPRTTYRLVYKLSETGAAQEKPSQQVSLIATAGTVSSLKQGSRIPIMTGSFNTESRESNTQVQYQDIGLSIDATLDGQSDKLALHTRIVESSVAGQATTAGTRDPDVRQTVLDGFAVLSPGKPFVLGSLDVPGTSQREEVEVTVEAVK